MRIQKFEREQLLELENLFKASLPRDQFTQELLIENVIDDMKLNPELCISASLDEKLVAFGMGVIRERADENVGYIKFLVVHPDYRRKGFAREIYNSIEKGISEKSVSTIRLIESWPNYYMPGIDPFYTEAVAFFERMGYIKIGDAANLICDLNSRDFNTEMEERRAKELNIEIRRANTDDHDDLMDWADKNFSAWRFEIGNALENDPVSLHMAKLDGEIIAFSAHSSNNPGLPWFGPVGTTEAARGKGIGGILLKRCLKDMKDNGYDEAIIPWVAHIPFYMHYINSKVDRVFWRYEKKLN